MVEKFDFDGELLTARQISERIPALSPHMVRDYAKKGCKTRMGFLTFRPTSPQESGARGAKRAREVCGGLSIGGK